MAKVIKTLVADDGTDFTYIKSFKTENYIGLYDSAIDNFVIIKSEDDYFEIHRIDCELYSLEELDDVVYEICDEHIEEVFDERKYRLTLEVEE